jgi:hypothetical protein
MKRLLVSVLVVFCIVPSVVMADQELYDRVYHDPSPMHPAETAQDIVTSNNDLPTSSDKETIYVNKKEVDKKELMRMIRKIVRGELKKISRRIRK